MKVLQNIAIKHGKLYSSLLPLCTFALGRGVNPVQAFAPKVPRPQGRCVKPQRKLDMTNKWFILLWPFILAFAVVLSVCPLVGWSLYDALWNYQAFLLKRTWGYAIFAGSMLLLSIIYWYYKPGRKSLIASLLVGFGLFGPHVIVLLNALNMRR